MNNVTCREIYDELREWYIANISFIEDEYEGQNKLIRRANIYAIQNTKSKWQIMNRKRK